MTVFQSYMHAWWYDCFLIILEYDCFLYIFLKMKIWLVFSNIKWIKILLFCGNIKIWLLFVHICIRIFMTVFSEYLCHSIYRCFLNILILWLFFERILYLCRYDHFLVIFFLSISLLLVYNYMNQYYYTLRILLLMLQIANTHTHMQSWFGIAHPTMKTLIHMHNYTL